jgi:hypothetical protein
MPILLKILFFHLCHILPLKVTQNLDSLQISPLPHIVFYFVRVGSVR